MTSLSSTTDIGYFIHARATEKIQEFLSIVDEQFTWLDEILVEAKKAFATSEIQLLPKTPSTKRARRRRRPRNQVDDDTEDESQGPPKKSRCSTRAKSKRNSATGSQAGESTASANDSIGSTPPRTRSGRARGSRSNSAKPKKVEIKVPATGAPVMNLVHSVDETIVEETITPDKCPVQNSSQQTAPSATPKRLPTKTGTPSCIEGFDQMKVRDKVHAYEGLISSSDESHTPKQPMRSSNNDENASNTEASKTSDHVDDNTPPASSYSSKVTLVLSTNQGIISNEDSPTVSTSGPQQAATVHTPAGTVVSTEADQNCEVTSTSHDYKENDSDHLPSKVDSKSKRSSTSKRLSARRSSLSKRSRRSRHSMTRRSLHSDLRNEATNPPTKQRKQFATVESNSSDDIIVLDNTTSEDSGTDSTGSNRSKLQNEGKMTSTPISMAKKDRLKPKLKKIDCVAPANANESSMRGHKKAVHSSLIFSQSSSQDTTSDSDTDRPVFQVPEVPPPKQDSDDDSSNEKPASFKPLYPKVRDTAASMSSMPEIKKNVPLRACKSQTSCSSSTDSDDDVLHNRHMTRVTRSKMRVPPVTTIVLVSESDLGSPSKVGKTNTKVCESTDSTDSNATSVVEASSETQKIPSPRKTRSKIRQPVVPKAAVIQPVSDGEGAESSEDEDSESSDEDVPEAAPVKQLPFRSTRSKARTVAALKDVADVASPTTNENKVICKRTRVIRKREPDSCEENEKPSAKLPRTTIDDSNTHTPKENIATPVSSYESDDIAESSPECPSDKIVRPHPASFLNALNKNRLERPGNLNNSVTSFIQRNTPKQLSLKEKSEIRKRELEEKQKKDQERMKTREDMLKKKIEDQKRKREEKMKRVASQRDQMDKETREKKKQIEQKSVEKKQMTEKMREEKLKEDRDKMKQKMKKMAEAEERRRQEEEARKQKQKEQVEEKKKQEELLLRKREFEEHERLKKLEDVRKKQEERLAEINKQREEENNVKRQQEEEKEQERLKQIAEREKELIKERLEREKAELEKQKERERLAQEQLYKQREELRQRLKAEAAAEMAKKEEERRRALQDKQNTMNTSLNQSINKSKLNSTYNRDDDSPSSYEMTPQRKYMPSTAENYDINDLHSDDSTDDEDRPRKKIPNWATGSQLKVALINQHVKPPNLEELFNPVVEMPDLNVMFKKRKPRFNKRTSSACWDSPLLKSH